jgi:hypothetical protein
MARKRVTVELATMVVNRFQVLHEEMREGFGRVTSRLDAVEAKLAGDVLRNQPRRRVGTTRAIPQPVQSLLLPTMQPLVRGLPRYAGRGRGLAHGPVKVFDALDQQQTAEGRCLLEWDQTTWPHTSVERQAFVNNLSGHYS